MSQNDQTNNILKHWRQIRRISQLDLALEIGISSRHLSFIETGKATPSRELVLKLSDILNLPLRDRNAFLLASGFAPEFSENSLETAQMTIIYDALRRMLSNHEPYPGLVVNATYDILLANDKFVEIINWCAGAKVLEKYANIYRLTFANDGLKPYLRNWLYVKNVLLARLWGEVVSTQDSKLLALYEELKNSSGPMEKVKYLPQTDLPVLDLVIEKDGLQLRLFSTITTFGTPLDVTVQGLRIDCMFPADDKTKTALINL